jgi:hypothetical protein
MWIAAWVDVPLAAIDVTARDVEHGDHLRHVEIALPTWPDTRVLGAVEEEIHPADLEIQPDEREHVGLSQLQDEAGLRVDEVRVLIALADVHDRDT